LPTERCRGGVRYEDEDRFDSIQRALDDGFLTETSSEQLEPNEDFELVVEAAAAVRELQKALTRPSDEFEEWFRSEYGKPLDLRKRAVWDDLLR
jgi:hypothetical protein